MFFESYFAPKKKKNNHTAAKIIGGVAIAAFCPLAVSFSKKKKKWGVGSLAFSITGAPSKNTEDKREITLTFPGVGFIVSSWNHAVRLATRTCKISAATRRAAKEEEIEELFDDETITEPEVTVE